MFITNKFYTDYIQGIELTANLENLTFSWGLHKSVIEMLDQTRKGSDKTHQRNDSRRLNVKSASSMRLHRLWKVAEIKDRKTGQVSAEVEDNTDQDSLQKFVVRYVEGTATVYSDDAQVYAGSPFPKEFHYRHNIRQLETIDQIGDIVSRMQGKRLKYAELVK